MKFKILLLFLLAFSFTSNGQFFQFSQRHFVPQRVNPGRVSSQDYFHAMLNYRNQLTAGDFSLSSTALDVAYPLSARGKRFGGVGLFVLDDRSGGQDVFSIQEVGLTFSTSVQTSDVSSFNLGVSAGYHQKSLGGSAFSTGSQFVPDRGFDTSIPNGETFADVSTNFFRWNGGIFWRQDFANTQGQLRYYGGVSVFDLNQPNESLLDATSQLQMTFLAEAGIAVHATPNTVYYVEAIAFGAGGNYASQAGVMIDRRLKRDQHLILKGRYSTEQFVILSGRIEKGNFVVGASYDLPIGNSSVANQSAFEVGLGIKLPVRRKGRLRRKRAPEDKPEEEKVEEDSVVVEVPVEEPAPQPEPEVVEEEPEVVVDTTRSESQPETQMNIGPIRTKERIVEEFQVRLPFKFNSSELSEEFEKFLDDIVTKLEENPNQKVQVIGHTDNVGPDDVNERLSLERAQAAADYLKSKGIAEDRILVFGMGETLPLASNNTSKGRALNRRVEITILK